MKLKVQVIDETVSRFKLVDVSTLENQGAVEVILDFPNGAVTLSNSTTPESYNFINPYLNVYLDLENWGSGVYEFDYQIRYLGLKNITLSNSNLIHATGIIHEFRDTNWIFIDRLYEIDKTLSSDDVLFLKSPVKAFVDDYKIVFRDVVWFVLIAKARAQIAEKIAQIPLCDTCYDLDKLMKMQMFLVGLKGAEVCDDLSSAKRIWEVLDKMLNDLC